MPRKTHPEKPGSRGAKGKTSSMEVRTPRPKPKIDFTFDALDYKNVTLLKQTYRAIVLGEYIRSAFEDAVEEAQEDAEAIVVPVTLRDQVEALLKKDPTLRWDRAVAKIARKK